MPGVETATLIATCGDPQTGSTTVFVNTFGVSRVGTDMAIGPILGPGSQTVFAEGFNVSLPGDVVSPHPPCPIIPIHCAALTNPAGSLNVFAGTGFSSGEDQPGLLAAADLRTTFLLATPNSIPANIGTPPVLAVGIPVTFSYSITNTGDAPASNFTIGLWRTPDLNDDPTMINQRGPFMLTRTSAEEIGATLIDTEVVTELDAGETYTGTFTYENDERWSNLLKPTWFAVYPDIDDVIGETDEANWFPSVSVTIT